MITQSFLKVADVRADLGGAEGSHVQKFVLRKKVVIVGDECVGKTSLVQSFESMGSNCPKHYIMTFGVELSVKEVNILNTNVSVDLHLYTTGGQSIVNQREMSSPYWDKANYVVCVFDIGSRRTFQNCTKWVMQVRGANQSEKLPCILIGNKADYRGAVRF